jgi:hypothetical protein
MNKLVSRPKAPIVTVGDLIGHLCRWPDHAVVTFKCPLDGRELHFGQIESASKGHIEIGLDVAPEHSPHVAPVAAPTKGYAA